MTTPDNEYKIIDKPATDLVIQLSFRSRQQFQNAKQCFEYFFKFRNLHMLLPHIGDWTKSKQKFHQVVDMKVLKQEPSTYQVKKKVPKKTKRVDNSTMLSKTVKEFITQALQKAGFRKVKVRQIEDEGDFYVITNHKDNTHRVHLAFEHRAGLRVLTRNVSLKDSTLQWLGMQRHNIISVNMADPRADDQFGELWLELHNEYCKHYA